MTALVRPEDIDSLPAEQRGEIITKALEESKSWLAVATKGTDPTPIAEFKAWAATVAEMAHQKGLAEEIQLDALEMVRRAERGIGVAIRNGQESGEIRTSRDGNPRSELALQSLEGKRTVADAAKVEHYSALVPIYEMTDGVTDEEFEEAIEEGRDEKNLSRANVARKAQNVSGGRVSRLQKAEKIREMASQGYSSRQMEGPLSTSDGTIRKIARAHGIEIPADRVTARTKRIDPERVMQEAITTLQGVEYGLGLLSQADYDAFTPEQVRAWLGALSTPYRAIRGLMKELNNRV